LDEYYDAIYVGQKDQGGCYKIEEVFEIKINVKIARESTKWLRVIKISSLKTHVIMRQLKFK
jgi:hypothetical protein